MGGSNRKSKTSAARLKQIDRIVSRLDKKIEALKDGPHVPRKEPLPRGRIPSPLTECDPSCPTCADLQRLFARKTSLRDPQQDAIKTFIQDRLAGDRARAKGREKINMREYLKASYRARTRKELASLLQVTGEGMRRWEKRNHIKWTKDSGLQWIP